MYMYWILYLLINSHTYLLLHCRCFTSVPSHTYAHMQDSTLSRSQNKAVDLIKYFDRMYRNSPDFRFIALSQEFIDSLASVLFSPITFGSVGKSESETGEGEGGDEWVSVCVCVCVCVLDRLVGVGGCVHCTCMWKKGGYSVRISC